MKIVNFKLPIFSWNEGWGASLNFKLTQIVQNITYLLNRFSDGYMYPSTSVTATYSANFADTVIFANGTFTITLPDPAKSKDKLFIIKNTGAGTITVAGITGNVDGAANTTQATMVAKNYTSDGTNYWIV